MHLLRGGVAPGVAGVMVVDEDDAGLGNEVLNRGHPGLIRKSRGRPFLGCSAYPKCKSTKPLPPELEKLTASGG